MSLYNLVCGENESAHELLALLNLHERDIPRYRDCYYDKDTKCIGVHTRTGGGNRKYYENKETCKRNYPEYFKDGEEPEGPWNDDLMAHPWYLENRDCDYDETYADFYFKPPQEIIEIIEKLNIASITPEEKWDMAYKSLEELKNG